MQGSQTLLVGASVVALAGSMATAAPQFEYVITGSFGDGSETLRINDDSLINRYVAGGSNGSLLFDGESPINEVRTEIFSDPDITPSPHLYADIRSFGYFGLVRTYDLNDEVTDTRFFIAAQPSTIAGQAFDDVFADFLTAHPGITSLADFIQIIDDGPDVPTPGANTAWIDFNDSIAANEVEFAGAVATTFQPGEVLDLVVFDNSTGLGSNFGDIQITANQIPEPVMFGAILPALAMLRRRRK